MRYLKEDLNRKVERKEKEMVMKRTNVYCQESSKYIDRITLEEM